MLTDNAIRAGTAKDFHRTGLFGYTSMDKTYGGKTLRNKTKTYSNV